MVRTYLCGPRYLTVEKLGYCAHEYKSLKNCRNGLIKDLENLSLAGPVSRKPSPQTIIRACIHLYRENILLKRENEIPKYQNGSIKSVYIRD